MGTISARNLFGYLQSWLAFKEKQRVFEVWVFLALQAHGKKAMLVPKQWKNVAQVLHNNRVKFPKDFFAIVLSTNMAAVMSDAMKE